MSHGSDGRSDAGGVVSRVVTELGRLVQVAVLAWSVLVGFPLVVGVVDWVADTGTVEPGGPGFVAVVGGVFAAPLVGWAGVRRTRGRPLSPPTPTTDDRPRTRALFARRGSLHPVTLAVLLVRALVVATVVGSVAVASAVLAVDGDGRTATAALTAGATTVALWAVVERTAVEWMLFGVDGGVPLRTVAAGVAQTATGATLSLPGAVERAVVERSAMAATTVDATAPGVAGFLASALGALVGLGRGVAVRGRRAAARGRRVVERAGASAPDRPKREGD